MIIDSPLPVAPLADAVEDLWRLLPHHSVSLTGGEPLMQGPRVAELAKQLAGPVRPVMLETNGTLVAALRRMLPWIDLREHGCEAPERRRRTCRPGRPSGVPPHRRCEPA